MPPTEPAQLSNQGPHYQPADDGRHQADSGEGTDALPIDRLLLLLPSQHFDLIPGDLLQHDIHPFECLGGGAMLHGLVDRWGEIWIPFRQRRTDHVANATEGIGA